MISSGISVSMYTAVLALHSSVDSLRSSQLLFVCTCHNAFVFTCHIAVCQAKKRAREPPDGDPHFEGQLPSAKDDAVFYDCTASSENEETSPAR